MIEAYSNVGDLAQAFETAKTMFLDAPSFLLYKQARGLAEKTSGAPALLSWVEGNVVQSVLGYQGESLLRDIYSFEGEAKKLLDIALSKDIDRNYYDRKYIALSLIYRALVNEAGVAGALSEYIAAGAGQDGIGDMVMLDDETEAIRQDELLAGGVVLLKGIVQFHVSAAKRNRYAKAAYYMCVLRDVFSFRGQEDDFQDYFKNIMMENSRRPALRDEMRIVYAV
jgi:hypothetical protein